MVFQRLPASATVKRRLFILENQNELLVGDEFGGFSMIRGDTMLEGDCFGDAIFDIHTDGRYTAAVVGFNKVLLERPNGHKSFMAAKEGVKSVLIHGNMLWISLSDSSIEAHPLDGGFARPSSVIRRAHDRWKRGAVNCTHIVADPAHPHLIYSVGLPDKYSGFSKLFLAT